MRSNVSSLICMFMLTIILIFLGCSSQTQLKSFYHPTIENELYNFVNKVADQNLEKVGGGNYYNNSILEHSPYKDTYLVNGYMHNDSILAYNNIFYDPNSISFDGEEFKGKGAIVIAGGDTVDVMYIDGTFNIAFFNKETSESIKKSLFFIEFHKQDEEMDIEKSIMLYSQGIFIDYTKEGGRWTRSSEVISQEYVQRYLDLEEKLKNKFLK